MHRLHLLRTVSTLAIVSLLSACGGGGSEARLTKAEYVKKANGICKTAQTKADKLTKGLEDITGEDPGDADKVAKVLKETIDLFETAQGDISELKGPEADDKTINAMNKEADKAIQGARDATEKLEDEGDLSALDEDPFEKYNEQANEYGIKECGF